MNVLLLPLLWMASCDAARILGFFPLAAKSHHYVFRSVLVALAKKGHEVVYLTAFPYDGAPPAGLVQIDISHEVPEFHTGIDVLEMVHDTAIGATMRLFQLSLRMAPHILGNPTVQKLIHSDEKFDAVILEAFFVQEYTSALVHKFGAVGIDLMSLGDFGWMNELAGLPDNPAYQVDFKARVTQTMDFWQRLYNTYVSTVTTLLGYYCTWRLQGVMDQYFNYTGWEARPSIFQLASNKSLILVNYHFAIGYPAPMPPHRKDIGGVHIQPNKPLPKSIQTYMDESENGVIYFSLGTNLNVSHPSNRKMFDVFIKVFEELPQKALMKWETYYTGNKPKNIRFEKWLPQQSILAHKKCLLFITHGGYLSLTEAVHYGVPVIGVPFFGDQPKNYFFVEEAGIGKMISLEDINYETVSKAVREVLTISSYKEAMAKRSKMFRDRPMSPAEEAVYWIEQAIKYPNALTPKAASLSFLQLHLIDLKLFLAAVCLITVFVFCKLLTYLAALCRSSTKSRNKKVKKH